MHLSLVRLALALTMGFGLTTSSLHGQQTLREAFDSDPIPPGRFLQHTADTESRFTFDPANGRLQATLDVDASIAYYLSQPLPAFTDATPVSFSMRFRVLGFESIEADRSTAILGLFQNTNHVEFFGDGLSLILSVANNRIVANANVDQTSIRTAGGTVNLQTNTEYLAIARYTTNAPRTFAVALFDGPGFTNLVDVSSVRVPSHLPFQVDRIGIQNTGARPRDSDVGFITLSLDEWHVPAEGEVLVSIDDAEMVEGDSGSQFVPVTLRLSAASDQTITVNYSTSDLSALSGSDYRGTSGPVVFPPGTTTAQINVEIFGDRLIEPNETFEVRLLSASNAFLIDRSALVTLRNDDGIPGQLHHFSWDPIPSPQGIRLPFPVVITARDALGQPVTSFAGNVALSSPGIPILPSLTDPFSQGVWSGSLTVLTNASAMTVLADDRQGHSGLSNPFDVGLLSDLVLSASSSPDTVRYRQSVSLHLQVTNIGLNPVHNVVFTDRLPPELQYQSHALSPLAQGSCELDGQDLVCNLGTLDPAASVTIDITALALAQGFLTNRARVFGIETDASPTNNVLTQVVSIAPAQIAVLNASAPEGDAPPTNHLHFTVRVSPTDRPVSVDYRTIPGSAHGTNDYVSLSGSLTFPSNTLTASQTVPVPIVPDLLLEPNETLFLRLSNPSNAIIFTNDALGTILDDDDDHIPCVSVSAEPATIDEGQPGETNVVLLTFSLSHPSGYTVSVDYGSFNLTAAAFEDFVPLSARATFPPGVTSLTVPLFIRADTNCEPDETFGIRLSNPANATLCSPDPLIITIRNDDCLPGQLDHFVWDLIPSPQGIHLPFPVVITAKDAQGQTVTSFSDSVSLTASSVPVLQSMNQGASSWRFPLASANHDARTQGLYLASELGGPGTLTALSLYLNTLPARSLANFTLRLRPYPLAQFAATPAWESSGWSTVYRRSTSFSSVGWNTLTFSSPFQYDGTNHLLVDFSFDTAATGSDALSRAIITPTRRALVQAANSNPNAPITWSARNPVPIPTNRLPELRFSFLRPLPILPSLTDPFSQGVWSGSLTVLTNASAMTVLADDRQGHSGLSNPFDVGLLSDLVLSASSSPDTVRFRQSVSLHLQVTNIGLNPVHNVVFTDRLPPELQYQSHALSPLAQGSCELDGQDLICNLGTVEPAASVTIDITALALAQGFLTNRARVFGIETDASPTNNVLTQVVSIAPAQIAVLNASAPEGDAPPTNHLQFTVRVSPTDRPVSVDYRTIPGTASSGIDFVPLSGSLTFPSNTLTSSQSVSVPIVPDLLLEPNETLFLRLSNPSNAIIFTNDALGTILDDDDDHIPCVSVSSEPATIDEGQPGETNVVLLTFSLSQPSGLAVSVDYSSFNLTAAAFEDFVPLSARATFPPGVTSLTVPFFIRADTNCEPDETFGIRLSNPANASLCSNDPIIVTIRNDDCLPGQLDHFVWDLIPSPQGIHLPFPVVITAKDAQGQTVTSFSDSVSLTASSVPVFQYMNQGASSWRFPLASANHDARTQGLYLASELGGPGTLTALSLYLNTLPARSLANFTLRLRPYPLAQFAATPAWESSGWSTVYRRSTSFSSVGWNTLTFSSPFQYDGTNHLLVDFSFDTAATGSDALSRAIITPTRRALVQAANSNPNAPITWSARNPVPIPTNRLPELRFSFLRPLPILPSLTGNFSQGVWSGSLTVLTNASAMTVLADDRQGHSGLSNPFDVGLLSDLVLSASSSPDTVRYRQSVSLHLQVTNIGLNPVHNVVFTDRLPPELQYQSHALSPLAQGSCELDGQDLVCNLGTVDPAASVSIDITALALAQGSLTNRARVFGIELDASPTNNVLNQVVSIAPAQIAVLNASAPEGDAPPTNHLQFTVRVSPTDRPVSVDFRTIPGSAHGTNDYVSLSGSLTFPSNTLTASQTVSVPIVPDLLLEPNETLLLRLSNPSNATITLNDAVGTILDDDDEQTPCISLSAAPALIDEGQPGVTNVVLLTLALSQPSGLAVSVDYGSFNLTAAAFEDFVPLSARATFPPGVTSLTVPLLIHADTNCEPDETFGIRLSNPANASLCSNDPIIVTIRNDDCLPGQLDHFVWDLIPSPQGIHLPFPVVITAKDAQGQTVTSFSDSVSLTASSVPVLQSMNQGASSWRFPLASANHDARTQGLYLASELGGPGTITALSLYLNTLPARSLANFTLRLRPTTLTQFGTSPVWESSGWSTVYRRSTSFSSVGWNTLTFSSPFLYDGTNHLLVDFSFDTAATGSDALSRAIITPTRRALVQAANSNPNAPITWSARNPVPIPTNRLPELRFSFLRPLPILPSLTDPFSQGVWSGSLTVLTNATAMTVLADDRQGHSGLSNPFDVGLLSDLVLSASSSPDTVRFRQSVSLHLQVTNIGLNPVHNVVFTDRLPPELQYQSHALSPLAQGSCELDGQDLICNLGTVDPAASVTIDISALALAQGSLTNRARVFGIETDASPTNNVLTQVVSIAPAQIAVLNASAPEGDAPPTNHLQFTVRVSPTDRPVSVDFRTIPGSASSGIDFVPLSGSLTFPSNTLTASQTVSVPIVPDLLLEPNETLFLRLSNPSNAILLLNDALGTIENDDRPGLSIGSAVVEEGDSGTRVARFTVSLETTTGVDASVRYRTFPGSAIAGEDFTSVQDLLTFTGTTRSRTIDVPILGDTTHELDETFVVELFSPVGATLAKPRAEGTILNDDFPELRINDVTVNVALPTTTHAILTASLSYPSLQPISFLATTRDDTATAGTDYVAQTNVLFTLNPGSREIAIPIPVTGNSLDESTEWFLVQLSHPVHARLADPEGVVTIVYEPIQSSPPRIDPIPDQTIRQNSSTPPLPLVISDAETPADQLVLSGRSTDTVLLPDSGIIFGGTGDRRTLTLTPAPGQFGKARVQVTVTDAGGLSASTSFQLTVLPWLPPSVRLTRPATESTFTLGQAIPIAASASDSDGTVVRVDFLLSNGATLGSVSQSPFETSWNNAPLGTHELTAVATDNDGLSATSNPVRIHIVPGTNRPPSVRIASPANGSLFPLCSPIEILVEASDPDGPLDRVELFVAGSPAPVSTARTPPFLFTYTNTCDPGTLQFRARASDPQGLFADSAPLTVETLEGDIVIIRRRDHPEISTLLDHLSPTLGLPEERFQVLDRSVYEWRHPIIHVIDRDHATAEVLAGFRVALWTDLGDPADPITEPEIDALWHAWKLNVGIYLIGEHLLQRAPAVSPAALQRWHDLLGVVTPGLSVGPGTIACAPPADRLDEICHGPWGTVTAFDYPRPFFTARFRPLAEPRQILGDLPVQFRFPAFRQFDNPFEGRRIVQGFLVGAGPSDDASLASRKILFRNTVQFLLRGECDNAAASFTCPLPVAQAPCRPFPITAQIENNGRCPAGGLIVSNLVAEGLQIVGTRVLRRSSQSTEVLVDGPDYLAYQDGQEIIYALGQIPENTTLTLETWVVASQPGTYDSSFVRRVNYRPLESCSTIIRVDADCECPHLEVAPGTLQIVGDCPVESWIQISSDLLNWSTIWTNRPSTAPQPLPSHLIPSEGHHFLRLTIPAAQP